MKKVVLILVVVFVLAISQARAQAPVRAMDNSLLKRKPYEETKGSAYLNDAWSLGTLVDYKGNEYTEQLIRFDAYQDLIEISQNNQIMVASASEIPRFTIRISEKGSTKANTHVFTSGFTFGTYQDQNYFEVLVQGKIDLIVRHKITFMDGNIGKYGTPGSYRSYQADKLYFVLDKRGGYNAIKPSNKSVYKVFPKFTSDIEKFLEENRLSIRSESDLIQIIQFLNSR